MLFSFKSIFYFSLKKNFYIFDARRAYLIGSVMPKVSEKHFPIPYFSNLLMIDSSLLRAVRGICAITTSLTH